MIGTLVGGNLRIVAHLADGGTGTIYRAIQTSTDRPVAVKILAKRSPGDEEMFERFQTEVRSLARVTHPNVVRLYDCGQITDGRWYLSMELLEGRSLDKLLKDGPLPADRCLEIIDDVAAVLEDAHQHGIVHRDIKPPNVFLQRVGHYECVRLLDFGIARLGQRPGLGDRPAGTPAYMAPEQIRGAEVDGRADIYALGVVAYECLGGRHPYGHDTPITMMARHVVEPPQPLLERRPDLDIDSELAAFVMRLLDKDPDRRPADIVSFRAELQHFFKAPPPRRGASTQRRPIEVAEPPSSPSNAEDPEVVSDVEPVEAPAPTRPRRRRLIGLVSAGLLVALATYFGIQSGYLSSAIPRPPAAFTAASTRSSPSVIRRDPTRPARNVRVCYESGGGSSLVAPRLKVDGAQAEVEPRARCFEVSLSLGEHTFVLETDDGVQARLRHTIDAGTQRVSLLVP